MGAAFQLLGNPLSPLTEEPRSKEARIEHEEAVPSLKLQAGALEIPPCVPERGAACALKAMPFQAWLPAAGSAASRACWEGAAGAAQRANIISC